MGSARRGSNPLAVVLSGVFHCEREQGCGLRFGHPQTRAQSPCHAPPGRLELPTLRLTASRSSQLSYRSSWDRQAVAFVVRLYVSWLLPAHLLVCFCSGVPCVCSCAAGWPPLQATTTPPPPTTATVVLVDSRQARSPVARFAAKRSCKRQPAIAQLAEHLTVECRRNQMVPGSIPGGRTCPRRFPRRRACRAEVSSTHALQISQVVSAELARMATGILVKTHAFWPPNRPSA